MLSWSFILSISWVKVFQISKDILFFKQEAFYIKGPGKKHTQEPAQFFSGVPIEQWKKP